MKTWQSILFGIFLGILFCGVVIIVGQPPRGQPLALQTPQLTQQITLHISGAVLKPGVYDLPRQSRLVDAVRVAGGLLENADIDSINLATPLSDGEKINIPSKSTELPPISSRPIDAATTPTLSPTPSTAYPININSAKLSDLENLPGIGPSKAQQIILYRQEHGPFKTILDLINVPGIGTITFERLKDLITVNSLQ